MVPAPHRRSPPPPRTPMSSSRPGWAGHPALACGWRPELCSEGLRSRGAGPPGPPGQPPADSFVCDTSLPETPAVQGLGERGAGMKGVGWGPAWHSCSEGLPSAPASTLRSRGPGSRCLAREAPHLRAPFSQTPAGQAPGF